jgi:hypothetical protein
MSKTLMINPGTFGRKLVTFYTLLLLDIILNAFAYFNENTVPGSENYSDSLDFYIGIAMVGLEALL